MTTAVAGFDERVQAVDGGNLRQIIPQWNYALIAASVAVSLVGAFTSTQLICCARSARTFLGMLVWTVLSSFVFGFCAVFCIHEIAMLACELDVPIGIDPALTVLSAMLATLFTFAALAGGTFQEYYKDKRRTGRQRRVAGDRPGHVTRMMTQRREPNIEYPESPGTDVSEATDDWDVQNRGDSESILSDTRSDAGLLDQERTPSTSEEAIYGAEELDWQKPSSLATFIKHEILSLMKSRASSADYNTHDSRVAKSSGAPRMSLSDSSSSGSTTGLVHLPRAQKRSQVLSSNILVATVTVIYAGLTFANIVKGFLWSLSITSMHYVGILSLKIPDGFVMFNPAIVVLAATICWIVCIVGAICMDNMTDLLAQQVLFSVVATSGCAALHWTGMWSATFLTYSPPSDTPGYPIQLPLSVGMIAIVTCLAANFLLVRTATLSRNKLAEIVRTRRELWRTIAQKESAEAAALARSDFIASASHEIRTPLHHLQGYGDLLARLDLSDEARGLLHSIQGATKTLSSITNNVLDWSRIENNKYEYNATIFDIRSVSDSIVNLIQNMDDEANVEVFVVVAPTVPQDLFLDEAYLHRILMNLLSNATKFTKAGFILLVLEIVKNDLVMTITDTGHGIPAEFVPIMFEPFKQAQSRAASRGTGLGLSIIKQLVQRMDGTIHVESKCEEIVGEEGSGTTFIATIPLPQLASSVDKSILGPVAEAHPKVALLERRHNSLAVKGLRIAWEKFGYECTVFKPEDFAQVWPPTNSKWTYIMIDIDVLKQDSSVLLALQKDHGQSVLVTYNEQRDLQGLPELPAHLIPLRKPLVWHTFEGRIAAAKEFPAKGWRNVRFVEDDTFILPKNKLTLPPTGKTSKKYTILLVEDNPINQKLGKKMLTSLGYNVLLAEDGEFAIEQLRRHDELIDAVLMDQSMPRKDGVTATREIRAMEAAGRFSRMPRIIIAVTAVVGPHAQIMCQEAGMNDFLSKPLSLVKLEAVLSALLPRQDSEG